VKQSRDYEKNFRACRNYLLRTILKLDWLHLPPEHTSDGEIAIYVLNWSLGLLKDAIVPKPRSQRALAYLTSLQKRKHPEFFTPVGRKDVVTYALSDEVKGKIEKVQRVEEVDLEWISGRNGETVKQASVFNYEHQEVKTGDITLKKNEDLLARVKWINISAVQEVGTELILNTYSGSNANMVTTPAGAIKDYTYDIPTLRLVKGAFKRDDMKVNILGSLPTPFW